jgi:hypothetical protein
MSLLEETYEELSRGRIGDTFSVRVGDRLFYEAVTKALLNSPRGNFQADIANLPKLLLLSEEARGVGTKLRSAYLQTANGWTAGLPKPNDPALYWTGSEVGIRPHPGAAEAWTEEYVDFAGRVIAVAERIGPATIIEVGSGTGALTFHLINLARAQGLSEPTLFNIERSPTALAFSSIFAKRHGLAINHIPMDMGASLDHPANLDELSSRVRAAGRPVIVITHNALHPFYTDDQYRKLFPYLMQGLGAVAGIHLERVGFRTKTFAALLNQFEGGTYAIKRQFTECPADPLGYIEKNAANLGVSIAERIDLFPHFIPRNAPSFLRWSRP